jgi:protein involved in polysaccharide export with SLBB domain
MLKGPNCTPGELSDHHVLAPLSMANRRGLWWPLCMLALLGVSSCYYRVTTEPLPDAERSEAAPTSAPPYRLQVGDSIGVRFYQNKDFDENLVVRPDGKISLQLVPDIQAAGVEPTVLAAEIERVYRSELSHPRVAVLVRKLGGTVYVGGEVKNPGVVKLTANLTLTQAIQAAGGLLDGAHLSQVVLIRRGADGRPVGHAIDIRPVIGGTEPAQDVPLQAFDIAFVPRSKVADLGLFVKQYIRDLLPVQPGLAIPLF